MGEEIAKETVIEAKKESWNKYVSTITRTTSIKEIWTKINAISGKHSNQNKIILTINNEAVAEPIILVETLGEFFAYINSNKNYTNEFLLLKNEKENEPVIFHNKSTWYNKP